MEPCLGLVCLEQCHLTRIWPSGCDTVWLTHHILTHTHDSWLWSILPSRHPDYIQNGAHTKEHKGGRDQNCIFHLMGLKVRAKLWLESPIQQDTTTCKWNRLPQESVHILCRWRIRDLNEITKWDGTDRGLGMLGGFVQFSFKKKKIKHKMSNYLDPKICDKHLGSVWKVYEQFFRDSFWEVLEQYW